MAEDDAYDYVVIDMPPAFSLAARAARAAAFYFRGAEVKMELRIQLEPEVKTSGKIIALELSDFFS